MVPMLLKNAKVLIPSTIQPNLNNPDRPYQKVKVLCDGADDFLSINVSTPVQAGNYNMLVNYREGQKNGKNWHFFELNQIEAIKA